MSTALRGHASTCLFKHSLSNRWHVHGFAWTCSTYPFAGQVLMTYYGIAKFIFYIIHCDEIEKYGFLMLDKLYQFVLL